jgi:hypothetical protein
MASCLHALHITVSSLWLLWGLMGWKRFCVTAHCSFGHWVVVIVIWSHSGLYCFFSALFAPQHYSWLTGEPRGLYPVCVKYHYPANWSLTPLLIALLSWDSSPWPQSKLWCSLCLHRWSQRFSPLKRVDSIWSTEQTLDSSSPRVDREDRCGLSGLLLVVMDWCRVDYWLAPLII